jgi:hypothetical protein
MKKFLPFVCLAFLFQSCAAVPMVTSEVIERKMEKIQPGSPKMNLVRELGSPQTLIHFQKSGTRYEVWSYDMGHYWYHETRVLVLKNGVLLAVPSGVYELLSVLRQENLLPDLDVFAMQSSQTASN